MRFFLVGTDRASGTLRLLADETFGSRRDALEYLSSEAAGASLDGLDVEVFVADLEAAAPVLLVQAQRVPAVGESPRMEVSDGPETEERRAAREAAVEPAETEPVDMDPGGALEDDADDDLSEAVALLAESAHDLADDEPGPAEEPADEPAAVAPVVPEARAWPWDDAGPEPAAADQPPASAVPGIVPPLRAVVMGDYDDEPDGVAEADEGQGALLLAVPEVPVDPMGARDRDEGDGSGEEASEAAADRARETASGTARLEEVPDAAPAAGDAVAEETPAAEDARGAVAVRRPVGPDGEPPDTADYTCDDCVYVNTCPKHHESEPSSCGSFQWRIA
ncbi:MAG: hypothetical protein IBX62_01565 [Coriobacteriia bacterium]|nr:hypothetical protein [Coriobacteriia bacterium]